MSNINLDRIGTSFDEFLDEMGILNEVNARLQESENYR